MESTNYGNRSDLGQYTQYQVSATCVSIVYDGNSPPTSGSVAAHEMWYDNNTSVAQSQTFAYTATTAQTFTWSVTESLSVGVTISATEGVPSVASSTQSVTVTLGLSSTQGASSTQTQSWTVSSPVVVPPMSSVNCTMTIGNQAYSIEYTQDVQLAGYVNVWFNDAVTIPGGSGQHRCWFIPIAQVFATVNANNLAVTTGYQINGLGVIATAKGAFSGSQGVNVNVHANQLPLRGTAKSIATPEPGVPADSVSPAPAVPGAVTVLYSDVQMGS